MPGPRYVKEFEYPRSAGFSGSADKIENRVAVTSHTRAAPQRFAEGGAVRRGRPLTPSEKREIIAENTGGRPPRGLQNPPKPTPRVSAVEALRGKSRKEREAELGLRTGGMVSNDAGGTKKYARGGAVGHSAVQRSTPTTEADKEHGGKGPLLPGFKTGGTVGRNRYATGGTVGQYAYARGGKKKAMGGPVQMKKGGDVAQDRKMIKAAIAKHVRAPKPRGHGVKKATGGKVCY